MEKKINSWSDYDRMVKKELKGSIARFEDTYIYQLQEENEKLRQWDCNKDSRNSRQRVANKKLIKDNERLKKQYCERIDCAARLGESKKVEELQASVKYYVDILTDLKKWLEYHKLRPTALSTIYARIEYNFYEGVLNKIKELEEKNNV